MLRPFLAAQMLSAAGDEATMTTGAWSSCTHALSSWAIVGDCQLLA